MSDYTSYICVSYYNLDLLVNVVDYNELLSVLVYASYPLLRVLTMLYIAY